MNLTTIGPEQIARFFIAFGWIYHGLFPKLLHIAPLEQAMTAKLGFSAEISYWITKSAGIGEVIFGLVFIFAYRSALANYFNILAMVGLLSYVAVMQPMLLIEAFNPVTTNGAMIGFSLILLRKYRRT